MESLEFQRHIATQITRIGRQRRSRKKIPTLANWSKRGHQDQEITSTMGKKSVVNLLAKELSNKQMKVLKRGLNFDPTPETIPVKEMVAEVE